MKPASDAVLETSPPLEGAPVYRNFRDGIFSRVAERPLLRALPPEIELQSLWFAGAFGRQFVSSRGEAVEILQFGHWNHAAGPDFTDAVVSVDGDRRRGAIELDSDVRDWENHRHGSNPDYDDVVLHLFFQAPEGTRHFTKSSRHREITQVRLDLDSLAGDAIPHPYEAEAHLGRCSAPLEAMPAERIESLLRSAAQYRLERKAIRLRRLEEIHGRDEALYQGIAEAMGYRPNRFPMTVLAQRAPLATIRRLAPREREALLFGMAGFLDRACPDAAGEDTRRYLASLWESWWTQRSEFGTVGARLPRWKIAGVRPGNHPHRRIAALAEIVERWGDLSRIVTAGAGTAKAFFGFCESLSHPYWDSHFTLQAARADRTMALIGKSRAVEILVNHVYPLLIGSDPESSSDRWDEFTGLGSVLGNGKVRRASVRLFGNHPGRRQFLRKVFHQQALLQIYADFCLEDDSDCAACPFPEQLGQWR